MWSLGCILAQCYLNRHLITPNCDAQLLIELSGLIGWPPSHMFDAGSRGHSRRKLAIASKGRSRSCWRSLKEILCDGCTNGDLWNSDETIELCDLIARMLMYENRITPHDALKHPFFWPRARSIADALCAKRARAVSYTHLTLPTKA